MINLRDNQYLYEVKEYKLITNDKKLLTIQILKDVSDKAPTKYIAKPMSDINDISVSEKEFIGKGESEEQALQDCIDKIVDTDIKDILRLKGKEKTQNSNVDTNT